MKINEIPALQQLLKSKININGLPCKYGLGGIHGYTHSGVYHNIYEYDVVSMYPSIILRYALGSGEFRTAYRKLYLDRIGFKNQGFKTASDAVKLILNSLYGKLNDSYADERTQAPLTALSICLIGQQILTYAIESRPPNDVILTNTDAIWTKTPISSTRLEKLSKITKMTWEQTHYDKVIIRDSNSVLCMQNNKVIKRKGAFLKRCRTHNTNASIIQESAIQYLLDNVPVQESIRQGEPLDYMFFSRVQKGNCFLRDGKSIPDDKIRYYMTVNGDVLERKTPKQKAKLCKDSLITDCMNLTEFDESQINWAWYETQAYKLIKSINKE